jgi:predicted metal-dependent hydrolase
MRFALFRRVPADPPHLKVFHEGQAFKVALKRRPTAKRITLRVSNATGEVVLTIPERTDVGLAQKFADSHGNWIATRLAKVPKRVLFQPGSLVPLRGCRIGSFFGRTLGEQPRPPRTMPGPRSSP